MIPIAPQRDLLSLTQCMFWVSFLGTISLLSRNVPTLLYGFLIRLHIFTSYSILASSFYEDQDTRVTILKPHLSWCWLQHSMILQTHWPVFLNCLAPGSLPQGGACRNHFYPDFLHTVPNMYACGQQPYPLPASLDHLISFPSSVLFFPFDNYHNKLSPQTNLPGKRILRQASSFWGVRGGDDLCLYVFVYMQVNGGTYTRGSKSTTLGVVLRSLIFGDMLSH